MLNFIAAKLNWFTAVGNRAERVKVINFLSNCQKQLLVKSCYPFRLKKNWPKNIFLQEKFVYLLKSEKYW